MTQYKDSKATREIRYSTFALQLAGILLAPLALLVGGGYMIDKALASGFLFTAIGTLIGMIAGGAIAVKWVSRVIRSLHAKKSE